MTGASKSRAKRRSTPVPAGVDVLTAHPKLAEIAHRDPVVAYAVLLGQAWEDRGMGNPETDPPPAVVDEAIARIEAYEAMITVTKANTLAGAAAQLLYATTQLRHGFNPEELGAEVTQAHEREFDTLIRALDYALQTIVLAGGVDLEALGMKAYMFPSQCEAAERVKGGAS